MRVYVESNFLLELSLSQEQYRAATVMLESAERNEHSLVAPANAVIEPFSTLANSARGRQRLERQLSEELRQLGRSETLRSEVRDLAIVTANLARIEALQTDELFAITQRILRVVELIPIDLVVMQLAAHYRQRFGFSSQDAIIFGAILNHLMSNPTQKASYFVSKNTKDFDRPEILNELRAYDCEYVGNFEKMAKLIDQLVP